MILEFDPDADAIYLRLSAIGPGEVAETVELTPFILLDLDAAGAPLGVEFVRADELVPFLRRHADRLIRLPDDLAALAHELTKSRAHHAA
jgi:uncharacterized protein YuzE